MKRVLSSVVLCGFIFGLLGASVVAVRHAMADEIVRSINGRLVKLGRVQSQTGVATDGAAILQLEADAKLALRYAPGNGQYRDVLTRVHSTPRMLNASLTNAPGAVVIDLDGAYAAAKAAVVSQPSSAYAWTSLAFVSDQLMAQNRLPGGQAALEQALLRAAALGAFEPHVLRAVVDLGFANWDALSVASRQSVMQSVNHLAQRQPDDAISLSAHRGRLAEACMEKRLAARKECTISVNVIPISN